MSVHATVEALRDHAAGASAPGLEVHLGECRHCAAMLEAERGLLQEIDAVLGQLRAVEPSPALLVRARSLVDVRPASPRSALAAWAVAAAALALCVSVLVRQRVAPTPAVVPTPTAAVIPPAERLPELPPVPTVGISRPSRLPERSVPRSAEDFPVVPPGQERALVRFADLMASGIAVVPAHLLHPEAPIAEPPDLDRPLLTIEPMEAPEAPSEESRR